MAAPFAGLTAPANAQQQLQIPSLPMRLTRRLERDLSDGKSVIVERDWLIQFSRHAGEIWVTGHQTRVAVEAPAKIAAIADVERTRSTDGMFPIRLDGGGLILATGTFEAKADVAKAVEEAEAIINGEARSKSEQSASLHYLRALQTTGSGKLEQMQRDLFFPRSEPFRAIRSLALPDGSTGEFELEIQMEAQPGTSWLGHTSRNIITRVAGISRRSSELWNMQIA